MFEYLTTAIITIIITTLLVKYGCSSSETLLTKLIHEKTDLLIGKDIIINDNRVFNDIINRGEIGLAESYMNGYWESPDLGKTLFNLMNHQDKIEEGVRGKSLSFMYLKIKLSIENYLLNHNNPERAPTNISTHYDIGNDLYEKMLGKTMQYTCAYYNKDSLTLDEAEINKMELIAKKLDLKPGNNVLDLGCGFGSMAYHLATKYGVTVTGVTLSQKQVDYAKEHYSHDNVNIKYMDYRDVEGSFDRVYSVGLTEHIGSKNYKMFFNKCYDLLKDDGIMLCHTMGISEENNHQNEYFASTYIFPGAELPHINNITESFSEKWRVEDFQNMGISYSKTFDAWRKNIGDWSDLENYDIVFRRMWEYYLHLFAENFRYQNFLLWQFVVTKKRNHRTNACLFIRK